jgi:hypothetical protein
LGKQLSFFTLITIKKNGYGRKTYSRNIVESGFKLHEPKVKKDNCLPKEKVKYEDKEKTLY